MGEFPYNLHASTTSQLNGHIQLFLIEGVATVGLAFILALILPNSLKSFAGLSELEREYLLWSFEGDHGQQDNADEASMQKGVLMAATDPKTWLFMGTLYCVCGPIVYAYHSLRPKTDRYRSTLREL